MSVIQTADSRTDRLDNRNPVHIDLAVTPELDGLLSELARDLGVTKASAVIRAIALLKAAVDARLAGKSIGTASDPNSLDAEFVGF